MKKLNHEEFEGWKGPKELIKFVNENKIEQKDIVQIVPDQTPIIHLFYYTED